MADELRDRLRRFFEEHSTLVLATSADGVPWASALFYVSDAELNLYFASSPDARHAANISANAHVGAAVNAQHDDWQSIRGIQLEGRARALIDPVERSAAIDLYVRKFSWLEGFMEAPGSEEQQRISARLAASHAYSIAPRLIRLIDNTRGFGHRDELVLGSEPPGEPGRDCDR